MDAKFIFCFILIVLTVKIKELIIQYIQKKALETLLRKNVENIEWNNKNRRTV